MRLGDAVGEYSLGIVQCCKMRQNLITSSSEDLLQGRASNPWIVENSISQDSSSFPNIRSFKFIKPERNYLI